VLLGKEMQYRLQIQTCEEVLLSILDIVRQRGTASIHLLTIEDIITHINKMEMDFRTELIHIHLEQAIEDSKQN
jgi:acetolactate synthase regulatory subunit